MAVTFKLPIELEEKLRHESPDIDAEAREAFAVELFRRGRLSHVEFSKVLGLDQFETNAYLKRHKIFEGSLTMDDLDADRKTLEQVLGRIR